MTTQAQLVELAMKRQDNPGVRALLLSLTEAKTQLQLAKTQLNAAGQAVDYALAGEPDFSIPLDSSHIVVSAAKMSAAMTRMASDYINLATVLQALGEDISY